MDGEYALRDVLGWGLDQAMRPVDYIEDKLGGPGSLSYNPVGARISGARGSIGMVSIWEVQEMVWMVLILLK